MVVAKYANMKIALHLLEEGQAIVQLMVVAKDA